MRLGVFLTKQSFIVACLVQVGTWNALAAEGEGIVAPPQAAIEPSAGGCVQVTNAGSVPARGVASDSDTSSVRSPKSEGGVQSVASHQLQYQGYYDDPNPQRMRLREKIRRSEAKVLHMKEYIRQREERLIEMRSELEQLDRKEIK